MMKVRISDNVLDVREWPVRELYFLDGKVDRVVDIHDGVYSWDLGPAVGWTLEQLVVWLNYDATGRHPENYYEVELLGRWKSFVSLEELLRKVRS